MKVDRSYSVPVLACILALAGIALCMSCNDDHTDFPRKYVFSHVDPGNGKLYVQQADGMPTEIPVVTGRLGALHDTIAPFVLNSSRQTLFFEEIELLNADMIHLRFLVDGVPYDTTLQYTLQDKELFLHASGLSGNFQMNCEADKFEFCTSVVGAINGPNPPVHGNGYGLSIQTCLFKTVEESLDALLTDYHYVKDDTLLIELPRLVYDRQ